MSIPDPRDELTSHLPALRAFALSLARNRATADDMMQDTVLKAWSNMDKFAISRRRWRICRTSSAKP